jgi:hypothetical protein
MYTFSQSRRVKQQAIIFSLLFCFESIHPDRGERKEKGDERLEGMKIREAEGWQWALGIFNRMLGHVWLPLNAWYSRGD